VILLVASLAAAVVTAMALAVNTWFRGVLRVRAHKTTLVTLKSGHAFKGVLFAVDRHAIVLRNAEMVEEGGDRIPVPVDGELVVLRPDVAFLQFV
jgi:small nuclear ribonucleoprotein (snRNP)-like protein